MSNGSFVWFINKIVARSSFQKYCLFVDVNIVEILASPCNPGLVQLTILGQFLGFDLFVNKFAGT